MPEGRFWSVEVLVWWADLWVTPQAAAWDQSGRSLWRLAELMQASVELREIEDPEKRVTKLCQVAAQMTALEDRHGLSPKALLGLRWLIVDEVEPAVVVPGDELAAQRAKARRAAVGG